MYKGKKYYLILIPEKIYHILPVIENLLRPKIKGYSSDNLKEIISIIACHIRKDDNRTPLKITYIKKLVPQGDKYLSGLIDLEVVQRSGNPIPGIISYKYNFAPEYWSKYKTFSLDNPKLISRIEKAQHELRREAAKSVRGHSEQIKYLKQLTITNDYIDFIESTYKADTERYNYIKASATRIINGDIFYSVDKTSGRFHSNVTNMAKGLRPYLRIRGESLVNIDIKNSQPYLSTIILTNPRKVSYMTKNPAFAMLLQSLKVPMSQDVKKYISLVINGQLYEYLMQEFLKEGLDLTRGETKTQVLRILFAKNWMPKDKINRKARKVFINRFPTVHKIFSKVRGREKGDRFVMFNRFSILLQSIESYLMLDVIMKRIDKELPNTIAVTVHDSIMTGIMTNNVEAVRNIMAEELTSFVGFSPNIKIEENIELKENACTKRMAMMEEREEKSNTNSNQYVATTSVSLNLSVN